MLTSSSFELEVNRASQAEQKGLIKLCSIYARLTYHAEVEEGDNRTGTYSNSKADHGRDRQHMF